MVKFETGQGKARRTVSYSVRFTEDAESDLLGLYDYLLEQDPHTTHIAELALQSIVHVLDLLRQFP